VSRSEFGGPHGWNSLDNYLHVHSRRMQDFQDEEFVVDDSLTLQILRADRLAIVGRIRCRGGLFIDVDKSPAVRVVRNRRQVRIVRYTYYAGIEGSAARGIFRYDNAHTYFKEGHPDAHRKHRFDHSTWTEIAPPVWIGEDRWPHLSDVIEELREWWESTGRHLDLGRRTDV
jgi:hypothetical protein